MSEIHKGSLPKITIAGDRCEAMLWLPAEFDREQLTLAMLKAMVKSSGVEYTRAVEQALEDLLLTPPPQGETAEVPIARAMDPVSGDDGYVEWLVKEPESRGEDTSFYDRSPYVMVEAGQVLGRVHPPTFGEDGRDVMGGTRRAKAGRPAKLICNDTIVTKGRGDLIAQVDGMLVRTRDKARISQVLEIRGHVDFSTGHVDFDGDVQVKAGVRDRFEVRAAGNIEVRGLIEAASIRCGHDLVAHGGMAGRMRGRIDVGGDVLARYLDSVRGRVGGALCIDRELVNTELVVDGSVQIPRGSVIGGILRPGGAVEAAIIGSPGAARTTLVLGTTPALEDQQARLAQIATEATQRRDQLKEEFEQFVATRKQMNAQERERQTELIYEIQHFDQLLAKAECGRQQVEQAIVKRRTVDLTVSKVLHAGARLIIDSSVYVLKNDLAGPIRITLAGDRTPMCRQGSAPARPLAGLAKVTCVDEDRQEELGAREEFEFAANKVA